jgi:hypothetical protein
LAALTALDMPHFGQFHDDSVYWVCAKSLAEGTGYRIMSLPEQPYQTKYPPLYPLLLAGIWKLNPEFPQNLRLATLVSWLAFPVFLMLCWFVLRDLGLERTHRLVVLMLLALSPHVVLYSLSLMSEIPFACLLLACILLARRAEEGSRPWWTAAAAGALGGLAYLTRNAALPLLAMVPLYYLMRPSRRLAAVFAGAMLPAVVGWNWWAQAHAPDTSDVVLLSYTSYLKYHLASFTWEDVPVLVWRNLLGLVEGAGRLAVPRSGGYLAGFFGLASVLGAVWLARRVGRNCYSWFAVGYLLLLLPWHVALRDRYTRLLLPLVPLALAGFTEAFRVAFRKAWAWFGAEDTRPMIAGRMLAASLGVAALLSMASLGAAWAEFPAFTCRAREATAGKRAAYEWIRSHLPADATFLAGADPLLYVYTGRRAVHLVGPARLMYRGGTWETARLFRDAANYARERNLGYLFLDSGDGSGAAAGEPGALGVDTNAPWIGVVYSSPRVVICALEGAAEGRPPGPPAELSAVKGKT